MTELTPKHQRRLRLDEREGWTNWVRPDHGMTRLAPFALGDGDHDPLAVVVEYVPGCEIPPHVHSTDYVSAVLAGEIEVTRRVEEPGSIRVVRAGTAYGPLKVGPSGCVVLEFFADRSGSPPEYLQESARANAVSGELLEALFRAARAWTDAP